MNIYVKKSTEMKADLLKVSAGVRYWEDATVNRKEDTEGNLIPFRNGDYWEPIIDIETGTIKDWPEGMMASIHYKVCDDGTYTITDQNGIVATKKEGYVPDCLSPQEDGFGDYIILEVDEKGQIKGWEADFSDFPGIKKLNEPWANELMGFIGLIIMAPGLLGNGIATVNIGCCQEL